MKISGTIFALPVCYKSGFQQLFTPISCSGYLNAKLKDKSSAELKSHFIFYQQLDIFSHISRIHWHLRSWKTNPLQSLNVISFFINSWIYALMDTGFANIDFQKWTERAPQNPFFIGKTRENYETLDLGFLCWLSKYLFFVFSMGF